MLQIRTTRTNRLAQNIEDPRESEPQDPNTERPPGDWQGPVENPEPDLEPLRDPEIDIPFEESNDDETDGTIVV